MELVIGVSLSPQWCQEIWKCSSQTAGGLLQARSRKGERWGWKYLFYVWSQVTGFHLRENRDKTWLLICREKEGKEKNTGASPTNKSYWLWDEIISSGGIRLWSASALYSVSLSPVSSLEMVRKVVFPAMNVRVGASAPVWWVSARWVRPDARISDLQAIPVALQRVDSQEGVGSVLLWLENRCRMLWSVRHHAGSQELLLALTVPCSAMDVSMKQKCSKLAA